MPIAPWGGIGTEGQWTSVADCLEECRLDFAVGMTDLGTNLGYIADDVKATVRLDTGQILGTVSPKYGIVQNRQAFATVDDLLKPTGGVIEHAGMSANGMVFMVLALGSFDIKGDPFTFNAIATNSFNGKFSIMTILTPLRIFCQNQFSGLLRRSEKIVGVKHGGNAQTRLENISCVLQQMSTFKDDFVGMLMTGAAQELLPREEKKFYDLLLPLPDRENYTKPNLFDLNTEAVKVARVEWKQTYYEANHNADFVGTRFGLLNAYYDFLSHGDATRSVDNWGDKRFTNLTTGRSVDQKIIGLLT